MKRTCNFVWLYSTWVLVTYRTFTLIDWCNKQFPPGIKSKVICVLFALRAMTFYLSAALQMFFKRCKVNKDQAILGLDSNFPRRQFCFLDRPTAALCTSPLRWRFTWCSHLVGHWCASLHNVCHSRHGSSFGLWIPNWTRKLAAGVMLTVQSFFIWNQSQACWNMRQFNSLFVKLHALKITAMFISYDITNFRSSNKWLLQTFAVNVIFVHSTFERLSFHNFFRESWCLFVSLRCLPKTSITDSVLNFSNTMSWFDQVSKSSGVPCCNESIAMV